MWIFLTDAYVSIVAHRDKPDTVLVRARLEGDVERFVARGARGFTPDVVENTRADYRFRAEVPRAVLGQILATLPLEVTYDNFKHASREKRPTDNRRAAMLGGVWGVTRNAQEDEAFWGSRKAGDMLEDEGDEDFPGWERTRDAGDSLWDSPEKDAAC